MLAALVLDPSHNSPRLGHPFCKAKTYKTIPNLFWLVLNDTYSFWMCGHVWPDIVKACHSNSDFGSRMFGVHSVLLWSFFVLFRIPREVDLVSKFSLFLHLKLLLRLTLPGFYDSPYLKKIFQGIPWVSGFFFADHFVWNLFGSRKRSRVHWGFGGIFFFIGNCLCFWTVWNLFCLEGVVCPQGFWIWFWIFSVLDSGSWGLDFGVWYWTPTVWLSSASTWGAKSTHSSERSSGRTPRVIQLLACQV